MHKSKNQKEKILEKLIKDFAKDFQINYQGKIIAYINGTSYLLDEKIEQNLLIFRELLKEWNEKINLTAIVDDEEITLLFANPYTPIDVIFAAK